MNNPAFWQAVAIILLLIIAAMAIAIRRQHRLHVQVMIDVMAQSIRSVQRIRKEAEQRVLRERLSARIDQALFGALMFGNEEPITADAIQEMSRRARQLHERKLDEMAAGFEDQPRSVVELHARGA